MGRNIMNAVNAVLYHAMRVGLPSNYSIAVSQDVLDDMVVSVSEGMVVSDDRQPTLFGHEIVVVKDKTDYIGLLYEANWLRIMQKEEE